MVAAAAQPQQQQPPPPTSAEEEALKRNTDCVYFLASPLTCKKGSECEYRHSEYARVNPRDCYFWLHGNCLNPKCGFRHPPLDGLLGTQTAVPSGPSFPSLHPAATPATSAAHAQNSGKQTVPCIFFQKGLCLKGDRCAFLHGPNPTASKAPQQSTTAHSNELPSTKKVFGVLQKSTQEQKVTPANVSKAAVLHAEASKPVPRTEAALQRTTAGLEKKVPPSLATNDELPRYKATNVPPVINGNSLSRSSHLHQVHALDDQGFQHGKDAEEFMRESSPGFDVLVDDELGETDYYHDEDQYGRTRGHDGRNLNSVGEYDIGHSIDYNSMADIDRETFRDPRGHDSYDHVQGQYAWEQHKASSDRALVVSSHSERRSYSKAESPDPINGSDLRYRLSKQRKGNVLRSVVSLDYAPDNQVEERSHRSTSRRDALSSHESSLSGRLRGRIKLPRRSPVSGNDLRSEREGDRGRNWGPLSPGKSQTSRQGRLRDRIRGRVEEDDNNGGRNLRVSQMRRERIDDGSIDFAGPKRLAELKVGKSTENKEQQFLGKRKGIEDHQQREGDLSFEGPMPLSEILKRKRKSGGAASSELSSITKGEYNQKESKESLVGGSNNTADVAKQGAVSIVSREEVNSEEEVKSAKADAVGAAEDKTEVSQLPNGSGVKAEDGMIGDETMEDHELEGDDHRDGDYEYEQGDEGEYNYEEGENADPEDEYLDDEDGDDFAKKIGVMFS